MTERRRFLSLTVALTVVGAIVGAAPAISLARLTDTAASTKAIATDTLDPPTGLAATGGAIAALTWTPTVDSYAAGYEVRRGTVSGGPYALITTVTPRSAAAATDAPASNGTYYYVLRSSFQNWTSVDSNQVSATITLGSTSTGFRTCTTTSNAADTGGNNNGYELLAVNACGDDLLAATDANSGTNTTISCTNTGKDRHRFWDFGLGVPATVSAVNGIQVRVDEGMNNGGGTNQVCIELSWNGGTTWTTPNFFFFFFFFFFYLQPRGEQRHLGPDVDRVRLLEPQLPGPGHRRVEPAEQELPARVPRGPGDLHPLGAGRAAPSPQWRGFLATRTTAWCVGAPRTRGSERCRAPGCDGGTSL